MQSRRGFLSMVAKQGGALWLAGIAAASRAAEPAPAPTPSLLPRLREVLDAVGKSAEVVTTPDGTRVMLLPYGGRVLGLFAPDSDENFYWTHPALESGETARKFYASTEWHNSGGDRTWLAPEVDLFLPAYPDTNTYWQPRELDPGSYKAVRGRDGLTLVNRLTVAFSRSGRNVALRMTKSVAPASNPLRYERDVDLSGLSYAGYTQHTRLELRGERAKDAPMVGLWNLVQMPHGGELLIPVFYRSEPRVWFGEISPEDLAVQDRLIRYRMRARGEQKLGVRAVATSGRVGYLAGGGETTSLIVRNFAVNPSGEYVDVPWKDPDDRGYSTQACNVNSALGAFSELEYHIPAIGGTTGSARCDDTAQVWAFRGHEAGVLAVARRLLSADV